MDDPIGWHTIKVIAISNTFECYLDGNPSSCITATDNGLEEYRYKDGLVGLWVDGDSALFDNVKVVDLRYPNP